MTKYLDGYIQILLKVTAGMYVTHWDQLPRVKNFSRIS